MICSLKDTLATYRTYVLSLFFILSLLSLWLAKYAEDNCLFGKIVLEVESACITKNSPQIYPLKIIPGLNYRFELIQRSSEVMIYVYNSGNPLNKFHVEHAPKSAANHTDKFKFQTRLLGSENFILSVSPENQDEAYIYGLRVVEVNNVDYVLYNLILSLPIIFFAIAMLAYGTDDFKIGAIILALANIVFVDFGCIKSFMYLSDTVWTVPTSFALLTHGSLSLADYAHYIGRCIDNNECLSLIQINGKPVNYFPPGASIFLIPISIWGWIVGLDEWRINFYAAKLFTSISVVLVYLLFQQLQENRKASIAATIFFALATSHLSLHLDLVWSHNLTLLLSLLCMYLLIVKDGCYIYFTAPLMVAGYATRPDFSIFSMCCAAYILWRWPARFVRFLLLAACCGALLLLWFRYNYNHWLPPYYLLSRLEPKLFWQALCGQLFSPNRGLLVFNPIFALSFISMFLLFKWKENFQFYICIGIYVLTFVIVVAMFPHWWGGFSYGPRLYAPILGALTVICIPTLKYISRLSKKYKYAACTLIFIAFVWGVFVHTQVFYTDYIDWNLRPESVDGAPQRVWDFNDMAIFRAFK